MANIVPGVQTSNQDGHDESTRATGRDKSAPTSVRFPQKHEAHPTLANSSTNWGNYATLRLTNQGSIF